MSRSDWPELLGRLDDENTLRVMAIRQHLADLQADVYRGDRIRGTVWSELRLAGDELEELMVSRLNHRPRSPKRSP